MFSKLATHAFRNVTAHGRAFASKVNAAVPPKNVYAFTAAAGLTATAVAYGGYQFNGAWNDTTIEIDCKTGQVKITMDDARPEPCKEKCKKKKACGGCGPGYATPMDAYKNGKREKLLYMPCIQPASNGKADYLATVDADPDSPTYSKVIHRLPIGVDDELHHSGWNACSSCHGDPGKSRRFLILPGLNSGNINIVDMKDPKAPKLHKVVTGEEIKRVTGLTSPHTSHCLGSGEIMISMMGDKNKDNACGFILLDEDFNLKTERWETTKDSAKFGYDFWYQPAHNIMVSSEWGSPKAFETGFNPTHVGEGKYGSRLHFWDWEKRVILQTEELGTGTLPLEVRFHHDPQSTHGFVGAALESSVYHWYKPAGSETYKTEKIIQVEPEAVEGWALPNMPGLITDILLSMDDKYLYFSNWLHGDIRQYDISDPHNPKLVGQVFLGGSLRDDGSVKMKSGRAGPTIPKVDGTKLQGAPQMIQLSLDGKRLYVTNSLFAAWDNQFYPEMGEKGSQLLQIDVDTENGGLSLNKKFMVDFGKEPDGPVLAHEVRYPGGDCSSDIYL